MQVSQAGSIRLKPGGTAEVCGPRPRTPHKHHRHRRWSNATNIFVPDLCQKRRHVSPPSTDVSLSRSPKATSSSEMTFSRLWCGVVRPLILLVWCMRIPVTREDAARTPITSVRSQPRSFYDVQGGEVGGEMGLSTRAEAENGSRSTSRPL